MRSITLVLLFFAKSIAARTAPTEDKWCFDGCELVINYAKFNDTGDGSKKIQSCESTIRATSLYLCIDEYCGSIGLLDWLQSANATCHERSNATLPSYDIIDRYGPNDRARIKRLGADEALTFPMLGEVIIPEELFFVRAFNTVTAAYYEYEIHRLYGYIMYWFWGAVISVGIASRLIPLLQNLVRPGNYDGNFVQVKHSTATWMQALLKRYITIPATFNNRCSQSIGWCTVPTRVQSLTIFAFVLLNAVLCTLDYRLADGNLWWPEKRAQLLRYVSDRTGIIALINFPLIWLFGMRNDTLIWMTGWGFGTYNNFHRWVARVSTLQAVIHSLGYTVMVWEGNGWNSLKKYLTKHYFWNGELATIFMCALLAFSVYGLRRSHYETFLTLHILFSIIILLTMYYHVLIFGFWEWNCFIYPCVAFWFLDRLFRGLRILAFDVRFWNTKATATYDKDSHLVSLTVPCKNTWLKPRPGTYYYIHTLDDLLYAHQSHPFTLAYVSTKVDDSEVQSTDDERPILHRGASSDSSESDALLHSTDSSTVSPSLVFLIRPYDGFTARLAKRASTHQTPFRVLVDGPYGHTVPLRNFLNILFVVGGTGIAVPLSHLSTLLSGTSSVVNLRIIWAVREHAFLASVLREFRTLLEDERVELAVHITQDAEDKDDPLISGIKRMKLEVGRPDARFEVEHAAREAGYDRLAVVACGPARMADETRKACVDMLGKGFRGVDYFEESFKW